VWLAKKVAVGLSTIALACGAASPSIGNPGFEVICDGREFVFRDGGPPAAFACEWKILEGDVRYGGTWHVGDPGLDLSAPGRATVSQRIGPFESPNEREYVLSASVLRREGVSLTFELHWYRAISGSPTNYWAANPELIRIDRFAVTDEGLSRARKLVSVPADAAAVDLRVAREGIAAPCWVDEVYLEPLSIAQRNRR
jgi:hypothetical protein